MASYIGLLTGLVALITAILGVFKYFDLRSKRQQREAIGSAFKATVATLGGPDRVERLGSAILLRRFYNPDSEYSKPDMPYADEAIDVIAATLRGEPTGDVQKVLADGLAYVGRRGLQHKDFQRVNLSRGYLSLSGPAGHAVEYAASRRRSTRRHLKRGRERAPDIKREEIGATEKDELALADPEAGRASHRSEESLRLDVSHADFFQADLTEASFKEDLAVETVFYGAVGVGTVFTSADLTGADFRDADLRGANFNKATLDKARFDGAKLAGARFTDARGLPTQLKTFIKGGVYEVAKHEVVACCVFVSAPSVCAPADREVVHRTCGILRAEGVEPVQIEPGAYRRDRHLSDVKEALAQCAGLVAIGLPQLAVTSGTWRRGTDDERDLADEVLHTPWNDIETGIGVGMGIPILSIRAGCGRHGVFGLASQPAEFEQVELSDSRSVDRLPEIIGSWVRRLPPPNNLGAASP